MEAFDRQTSVMSLKDSRQKLPLIELYKSYARNCLQSNLASESAAGARLLLTLSANLLNLAHSAKSMIPF